MDLDRIKSLIGAMAASDLAEMEFSEGGMSLRLVRRPQPADSRPALPEVAATALRPSRPEPAQRVPVSDTADGVVAPLFGVAYLQPDPDAPPFVTVGQAITAGTTLCVIEAMKMFHEVRADRDGAVAAILVSTGQEVEAGQELMRIR